MSSQKWTLEDIPDQTGRVAIVTGANSGIGRETALALARKGATVVLACRSEERGIEAADAIAADVEGSASRVSFMRLDLADLESVRSFVAEFLHGHDRLDLLVNNAGVMVPPKSKTAQGFELQLGVNHFGHFALTNLLLPLLAETGGARVVSVASLAHRAGRMDFDDLDWDQKRYRRWAAYGQSKLANLLFTLELSRRLGELGVDVVATAAHPGWTSTDLQRHTLSARVLNPLLAMTPPQGALPTLHAATAPNVEPGGYFGPNGWMEMRGWPAPAARTKAARDEEAARRLWEISEERTGVRLADLRPYSAAAAS